MSARKKWAIRNKKTRRLEVKSGKKPWLFPSRKAADLFALYDEDVVEYKPRKKLTKKASKKQ